MIPGPYNITIYAGTTYGPVYFEFRDSNGDLVNLTGWQVWAWAKYSPEHGNCSCRTVDLAPTIPVPANGRVRIFRSAAQTALPIGIGSWDMLLQSAADDSRNLVVAGTFTIRKPDTNPPTET